MAAGFRLGAYRDLFAGGMAARVAVGGFLARFYAAMLSLATITMYVQEGHGYLVGGIAASLVAGCNFLIAPRVCALVDRFGQSRVVPPAMAIALAFLAAMLVSVRLHAPIGVSLALSVPLGCMPVVASITRARWSYLLRASGSHDLSRLQTAFALEGVLDDVAFMLSPSAAIAISTMFFPEAGLALGGMCYLAGMCIILSSRKSEPDLAFMAARSQGRTQGAPAAPASSSSDLPAAGADVASAAGDDGAKPLAGAETAESAAADTASGAGRLLFFAHPFLVPVFFAAFFGSLFYGLVEPATLSLCAQQASEYVSSVVFFVSAVCSATAGLLFGMLDLRLSPLRRLLAAATVLGAFYFPLVFVHDVPTLFLASMLGAFSWAPFVITMNATVEAGVEPARLTESLTWVNAGMQLGMVFGPSAGGVLLEVLGCRSVFICAGVLSLGTPAVLFACLPVLRRAFGKRR